MLGQSIYEQFEKKETVFDSIVGTCNLNGLLWNNV